MRAFGLQKNTVFNWENHQYKIERVTPQKQVILERSSDSYTMIVDYEHLLAAYQQGQISFVAESDQVVEAKMFSRPITDMPEKLQQQVKRRKHYIDRLTEFGTPTFYKDFIDKVILEAAKAIGDKQPPSMITLYRWYKKYISTQDVRVLIPRFDRRGRLKMSESNYSHTLLISTVEAAYKRSPQTTTKTIYNDYINFLALENQKRLPVQKLHVPSERTIRRKLASLGAYELVKLKEGKAMAERKFKTVTSKTVTHQILERVEVDHTPLDLFIIDKNTTQPMGRPTLTIMLDHYSRMVLGYYISFQAPSTAALMGALRHAILPKPKQTNNHGFIEIHHEWESYGVPDLVVADNGFEFHSHDFEAVAFDLGIRIEYCPKREPWYKGAIERFLKTLNYTFASQIPGASFARWQLRGDYDPLKHILVDFHDLQVLLEKWILDVYSQSYHTTLRTTPSAKWQEGLQQRQPQLPMSLERIRSSIGKTESRSLRNDGILLKGIRYQSHELASIVRTYQQGVRVRVVYDPEDMGSIQVYAPDSEQSIRIFAMDQEYANGLTEIQNKVIQQSIREKGMQKVDAEALSKAKFEISQAITQMQASNKLIKNKRAAKLSGISSSKPNSALLQSPNKKPKVPKHTLPTKHQKALNTPLPKLPKFNLRKGN